jgi:DNA-binding response OmpR family regulator
MLKVLIAEDDLMIADLTEEVLVESGFEVCGIARTVAEGVALGRLHKPDLALIDMHLADGGLGTEVAAELGRFGRVGVLFATGSASDVIQDAGVGDAYIVKPYNSVDLVRALEIVADIVRTGSASTPFPQGFALLPRGAAHDGVLIPAIDAKSLWEKTIRRVRPRFPAAQLETLFGKTR